MKTASGALTATLLTTSSFMVADLYEFVINSTTYRWTSADTDITSSSTTWTGTSGPILTRGSGRAAEGVEVSTMEITMGSAYVIGGVSASLLAINGGFDNVPVKIDRAFMTTWGSVPNGVVNLFSGTIVSVEPGSTEVRLTAKSGMYRLNQPTPKRLFQPQCQFQVYDNQCGLSANSFRTFMTTGAGSTTSEIVCGSAPGANANVGGRITFTGGGTPLDYMNFTIIGVSGNNLAVFPKFPVAPVGGTNYFYIYRGCDKTRATCSGSFSNIARFGGFPDAPPKENKN